MVLTNAQINFSFKLGFKLKFLNRKPTSLQIDHRRTLCKSLDSTDLVIVSSSSQVIIISEHLYSALSFRRNL